MGPIGAAPWEPVNHEAGAPGSNQSAVTSSHMASPAQRP